MNPHYMFVDLETTGLDCERDEIMQIAWVYDGPNGEVAQSHLVEYGGFPSLWVANNVPAGKGGRRIPLEDALDEFFATCLLLAKDGGNVYLVGACPAFDDRFLRKVFREVPYHYHVIDVEAMAMAVLGLPEPPSMKDLRALLFLPGENENAHDALADALEAKLIFEAVMARARG